MADIAELGFKVDTSGLQAGKAALEELPGAGGKAEVAADKLVGAFEALNAAVTQAAAIMSKLTAAADIQTKATTAVAAAAERAAITIEAVGAGAAIAEKGMLGVAAASEATAAGFALVVTASEGVAVSATAAAAALDVTAISGLASGTALQELGIATVGTTMAMEGTATAATTAATALETLTVANTGTAAAARNTSTSLLGVRASATSAFGAFVALVTQFSLITVALFVLQQAFQVVWTAIKALIPFVKLFQDGLYGLANVIPIIAPYLVILAAALVLIYAPAIVSGLGALIVLFFELAGAVAAATLAVIAFVGWPALIAAALVGLLAVAVVFRDDITHFFGVDIIGAVKETANYMINSLKAAFDVIASVWGNLPNILSAAMIGAVNGVISGINLMTKAAVEGINFIIQMANKIPGVNLGKADATALQIAPVANPAADAMKKWGDDTAKIVQSTMQIDRLGNFGKAIGTGAAWAAAQIKSMADALTKVPKKKKTGDFMSDADYQQSQVDNIAQKAKNGIAANDALIASIGMTADAMAEAKRQQELLNDAASKHIVLTDQQRTTLMALGKQWGDTDVAAKKAADDYKFEVDTAKGFVSDLKSGLEQGEGFWKSFSDAATNALNKITDRLLNQVIDALFQVQKVGGETTNVFSSLWTGISKIAGSAFSGLSSFFGGAPAASAKGNVFGSSGMVKYAKGGTFANSVVSRPTMFATGSGSLGIMGEAGPEAIVPLKRGSDGSLGVSIASAGGGGAANSNSPSNVYVDVTVTGQANVSQSRQTSPNGDQIIKLIIDTTNQGMTSGAFDKSMQARYAQKPAKTIRG